MNNAIKLLFILPIIFLIFGVEQSFGHGIGGESLPVMINDQELILSVNINPAVFDPENEAYYLSIKLADRNDLLIKNTTFDVTLFKEDKEILSEHVFTETGEAVLKLSKDTLGSGGLYQFNVKVLGINSQQNILDNPPSVNGAISMAENSNHTVMGLDQLQYDVKLTSYYDQIRDFEYDSKNYQIKFEMPFDWSPLNISQTKVVHQEIHVPKTFADMLATKYDAYVNGKLLPESSVTIDDYSEDARIIHLILNQNDLTSLESNENDSKMIFTITPSKETKFPLLANTGNAKFQVGLSWEPAVIYPNSQVDFKIQLNELFSDKIPKTATYDFVLKQAGTELFREKINGHVNSTPDMASYTFSSNNVGPIIASIDKINDEELATVEFVAVVKPQESREFPIRLSSQINQNGVTKDGSYFVDLTWIPQEITPTEESEFILTIYDKQTLVPVKQAEYDFIILQNDSEIFRKSDVANAGGSFVDYRFSESEMGQAIIRIENINDSQEFVEIPITVTPEFPASFLVLAVMISFIPVMSIFQRYKKLI